MRDFWGHDFEKICSKKYGLVVYYIVERKMTGKPSKPFINEKERI